MWDLVNDSLFLARKFGQWYDNFDHAQTILIEAQVVQVGVDLVKDKGLLFLVEASALEHLANDMSSLLIDRECAHMPLQCVLDKVFFLIDRHIVKDRLDCVRSLLVAADLYKVAFNQVQNAQSLAHWTIGQKLLEEVIPVLVHHDSWQLVADLL